VCGGGKGGKLPQEPRECPQVFGRCVGQVLHGVKHRVGVEEMGEVRRLLLLLAGAKCNKGGAGQVRQASLEPASELHECTGMIESNVAPTSGHHNSLIVYPFFSG